MGISQLFQGLGGISGEIGGALGLVGALVLTVLASVAERFMLRRKRIHYRVLYNSKIGLNPVPGEHTEASLDDHPTLRHLTHMVDQMSVVIVRVRNIGTHDIKKSDFDLPLTFTFGDRVIWDARISEASTTRLKALATENMEFFRTDEKAPERKDVAADNTGLRPLRGWLGRRFAAALGVPEPEPDRTGSAPQWHGVRLNKLSLMRGEKFKLVVVLQEPRDAPAGELTKTVEVSGGLENGWLKDEKAQPRFTRRRFLLGTSVLLTGALLATTGVLIHRLPPSYCTDGTVHVVGSSAFMPVVDQARTQYAKVCPNANIVTSGEGSVDGFDQLRYAVASGAEADDLAVVTDGPMLAGWPDELPKPVERDIADLDFTVVANAESGVRELSAAQLAAIYRDDVRDWAQLGGKPMPIKVIDRNAGSGTRRVFESTLLRGPLGDSGPHCEPGLLHRPNQVHCSAPTSDFVLKRIESTPGAIGYVESHRVEAWRSDAIRPVSIDANRADFRATEYLYTAGKPRPDSPLAKFLEFLDSEEGEEIIGRRS